MSQPANSVMVAPRRSCTERKGVCLGCDVTPAWYAGGMTRLTPDQVEAEIAATPGWELADGQIVKTVTKKDFGDALRFVNAVGYLAEKANHHPDIAISWNKVTLTLVSHSAGGLTGADFELARAVNALD